MRTFLVCIVTTMALALGACAARAVTWQPAGKSAQPWVFAGKMAIGGRVDITINGQKVMQGATAMWHGTTMLNGSYQGRPVSAACTKSFALFSTGVSCDIAVSGAHAATLKF